MYCISQWSKHILGDKTDGPWTYFLLPREILQHSLWCQLHFLLLLTTVSSHIKVFNLPMEVNVLCNDMINQFELPIETHSIRELSSHISVWGCSGLCCTLAARRRTASSLRRCISGVPGQLLVLSVLAALEGGVGCDGWVSGSSEFDPPPPGRMRLDKWVLHCSWAVYPGITSELCKLQ